MSHLEQEIRAQAEIISRLLKDQNESVQQVADAIRAFKPTFVWLAARGTSDNAARYLQYLLGIHTGLAAGLATPSVHTLYAAQPDLSRALVIGISQSGQSDDVREVLQSARTQGGLTLSMTNDPASPLAQEAAYHLDIGAGLERSIAATKTYTAELTLAAMLTAALVPDTDLTSALAELPRWIEETLTRSLDNMAWVERYRYIVHFAAIGRGYNYATAHEISHKIKELCYITGEEYSEADFRHGPIAVIGAGFPVIMVAPKGKALEKQVEMLHILAEKSAEVLLISNDESLKPLAKQYLPLPADLPEWLSPIAAVIPGQVFAWRLAFEMGHSIDTPRGLNKVTVTQ